jgi:hypothetical protein
MGQKAQKKSEQTNYNRQKAFIMQALAQLSPENIAQLQRMFLPQIMANQAASGQTAMHALQRIQANKGIAQSPISASQQLGLAANQGNFAQQQAFQQAFGLAQQRAGAWSGQPSQTQPNMNMTNAFMQAAQQGTLAAALQGKGRTPTPYDTSGPSWTRPGNAPEPTWGLPPQYEPPLFG